MSEKSDELRDELLDSTEVEIEVEKVVQLSRIADAMESIEETGVYTWPQWENEGAKEPRRG